MVRGFQNAEKHAGPCFQKICLKYAQFIKARISLLILYMQTLDHEILRQIEQKAHW